MVQICPAKRKAGWHIAANLIPGFCGARGVRFAYGPWSRPTPLSFALRVEFENGKIAGERIYWDQASVLLQIGLIDGDNLPVTGAIASRKDVDAAGEPSNELFQRRA